MVHLYYTDIMNKIHDRRRLWRSSLNEVDGCTRHNIWSCHWLWMHAWLSMAILWFGICTANKNKMPSRPKFRAKAFCHLVRFGVNCKQNHSLNITWDAEAISDRRRWCTYCIANTQEMRCNAIVQLHLILRSCWRYLCQHTIDLRCQTFYLMRYGDSQTFLAIRHYAPCHLPPSNFHLNLINTIKLS